MTPTHGSCRRFENAHSLFVETLAETGVVGLALLGSFFLLVLGAAVRLSRRSRYEARARAAGLTGALVAFTVGAAADWLWRIPVLPAAFLLLSAALLAPARAPAPKRAPSPLRFGAIAVAIASLFAIAVPLATVNTVRASQAAVLSGDPARALADARAAVRLESDAASPRIQLALVLELEGDVPGALAAAQAAASNEPANWIAGLKIAAEVCRLDDSLETAARGPVGRVARAGIPEGRRLAANGARSVPHSGSASELDEYFIAPGAHREPVLPAGEPDDDAVGVLQPDFAGQRSRPRADPRPGYRRRRIARRL